MRLHTGAQLARERGEPRVDSARGWLVACAAFLSTFTSFGVAYSFGAFFRSMASEFGAGRSATSLVFSITAFAYFLLGSVSGRIADRVGPRRVVLTGAVAMSLGLVLTSRVHSLALGYLTYGAGVGVGVACAYVPMVAAVGGWFDRRRGAALGVAVAGIGAGTLAVAPLAAALIRAYGWRTTYVLFGVASIVLLGLVSLAAFRPPAAAVESAASRRDAIRTPAFASLYVSGLLMALALFVPFVYMPAFAEDLGVSKVAAAGLVGFIGGASVIGRLALGVVADRMGRVRTYKACFFVMGASYTIWLVSSAFGPLVVFTLVMGFGYGGFIALSPAVAAELFGAHGLGGLLGLLYTGAAFGSLAGPPAAGLLIDATGGYRWAIGAAGVLALAAWGVLYPLRATPAVQAAVPSS
jgi:MFS family permease